MQRQAPSVDRHGQTKFEQTVWLHVVTATTALLFVPVWYSHGFTAVAISNGINAVALFINLVVWLFRPGTQLRFASIGIGIATVLIGMVVASVGLAVPLMSGFFIFPPIFGFVICGRRYLRIWSVATICTMAVALTVAFFTIRSEGFWRGQLSDDMAQLINGATAVSMLVMVIMMLSSMSHDHELYVATQDKQQATLRTANIALAEAQQVRARFFASASHELRTPIHAITGISELLRTSGRIQLEDQPLIDALHSSSEHLFSLINDLLDLGKLKENRLQLTVAEFEPREVVSAVFSIVKNAQRLHRTPVKRLRIYVASGLPQRLRGDRRRLVQVLLNLLNNAVKFTPAGDVEFLVRGMKIDNGVNWRFSIEIRDTGIGMSKATLDNLFSEYRQADEAVAANFGGPGLGLSISKRLMDLMGSTITVQSELGRGSIFTVTLALPIASDTEAVPAAALQSYTDGIASPSVGKTVLIVDDNGINLMIAKKLLEKRFPGLLVETADNGEQAVQKVRDQDYDLILMDMQMPVMDGLSATSEIRKLADRYKAQTPIVAVSANSDAEDIARCLSAGMNDTLSKPVEPKRLHKTLERFLGTERASRSSAIVIPHEGDFSAAFPRLEGDEGN